VECILKIVLLFEYVIPLGSPIYSLLSEGARDYLHPFRRIGLMGETAKKESIQKLMDAFRKILN